MKHMSTRLLVTLSLLIATEVVLNRFLSINAWNLKIGFSFVPVAIAAIMFGPIAAGLVGALGDLIGALLFPIGAYFPGFTLTAFITGVILGLFLHKKQTVLRIVLAVGINNLIFSLFLNSLWISILYTSPYLPLVATRVIQCAILIPVQIAVILVMQKVLQRIGHTLYSEA